jgi:hypothetical protein
MTLAFTTPCRFLPAHGQSHEDRESRETPDLKGHGFSRAAFEAQDATALAAEGCIMTT